MAILSPKGVKPEMKFTCCDCREVITGKEVIEGGYLYIVEVNKASPADSTFRCECCQDDYEERQHD